MPNNSRQIKTPEQREFDNASSWADIRSSVRALTDEEIEELQDKTQTTISKMQSRGKYPNDVLFMKRRALNQESRYRRKKGANKAENRN